MFEKQKVFEELALVRNKSLIIHYSGEGWLNEKGTFGRITSITIKNLRNSQLKTFSVFHEIQKSNLDISNDRDFDSIEKALLQQYFDFVKKHRNYKWIHWNMRFPVFGFNAIEDRFSLLGGKPVHIPDNNKIDFAQILSDTYGANFEIQDNNGKLINLLCRNNIIDSDIVNGRKEVEYFKTKDFLKIHLSNMKKVDGISQLYNLAVNNQLKTNVEMKMNEPQPHDDLNNNIRLNEKARIFIGSSVEGLKVAQCIQAELRFEYDVEIWNQSGVFGLGYATLEALEKAVKEYDFGIFVFTPDDELVKRGVNKPVVRDNVLFELGLFVGQLTRFRAFIVKPFDEEISLPTDLHGITSATYAANSGNLRASLGTACHEIRNAIERYIK